MVALGEVATIERRGVDPSTLPPHTAYLGLEHIERGGRIIGRSSVAEAELASTKFRFSADHILFGKLRPNLGKISRPDFDGVCSTDILPIRAGRDLDRGYLAHYLSQPSMVDFAASRTSGANLPRLSPSVLAQFPIPLPPLPEQRHIAAILDHADALRAKRRQVLAHLDALTQSTFHDMFGSLEWLDEFGSIIVSGPTNGLYRPSSDYGTGAPILRIDGFTSGATLSGCERWKRLRVDESELRRFALASGDIVINRVNALSHLGKSALVTALTEPSVFESNMMRVRVDTDRARPEFVLAWLQTERARQQILRKAKKAINQASINQTDVRSLLLPLPPIELQRDFSMRVDRVLAQRGVAEQALAADDELFASLQARAFDGRL